MRRQFEPAESPAEAAALANLVVAIADNKYFLAHRLASWGVGAPALESAVACTAIAQEEAGHARGLSSLLEDFPPEVRTVLVDEGEERERSALLRFPERNDSWYRAVAVLALIDYALTTALEACASSSFPELRKRAYRILGDESFHQRYVQGRLREQDLIVMHPRHVQRVLHRPCGMVRRDVARLEVVPVVLDLGSVDHAEHQPQEHVQHLVLDDR